MGPPGAGDWCGVRARDPRGACARSPGRSSPGRAWSGGPGVRRTRQEAVNVEPIPETVRAIEELGPFADGGSLLERLLEQGRRVSALVPDCIALTLASSEHSVTFALLVSRRQLGLLAALQAADEASAGPAPEHEGADLLSEEAWHRHALSHAAPCVATTLTLAVREPRPLAGEVTLYGASRRAFDGHHGHAVRDPRRHSGRRRHQRRPAVPRPRRGRGGPRAAAARRHPGRGGADRRAAPAARAGGGAAADPRRGRPRRDQRGAAGRGRDPAAPSLAFSSAPARAVGGAGGTAAAGSPPCAVAPTRRDRARICADSA